MRIIHEPFDYVAQPDKKSSATAGSVSSMLGEWAYSSRPSSRLVMRTPSDRISSRVARFFGKLAFKRTPKAPIVRVDALDDRVLRDIGVDRHQFEFWSGQTGPDGW